LMISNHYAFAYTEAQAWLVMSLLIFAGAVIRQFFVLMHAGKTQPSYLLAGGVLILLTFWVAAPTGESQVATAQANAEPNTTTHETSESPLAANVGATIEQHCAGCHSKQPENPAFSAPPAGFAFDAVDQILSHQAKIQEVVANGYMPLGNATNMTEEEREIIKNWGE